MKIKKSVEKKLTLNKNTVANLDGSELGDVRGGALTDDGCRFTVFFSQCASNCTTCESMVPTCYVTC